MDHLVLKYCFVVFCLLPCFRSGLCYSITQIQTETKQLLIQHTLDPTVQHQYEYEMHAMRPIYHNYTLRIEGLYVNAIGWVDYLPTPAASDCSVSGDNYTGWVKERHHAATLRGCKLLNAATKLSLSLQPDSGYIFHPWLEKRTEKMYMYRGQRDVLYTPLYAISAIRPTRFQALGTYGRLTLSPPLARMRQYLCGQHIPAKALYTDDSATYTNIVCYWGTAYGSHIVGKFFVPLAPPHLFTPYTNAPNMTTDNMLYPAIIMRLRVAQELHTTLKERVAIQEKYHQASYTAQLNLYKGRVRRTILGDVFGIVSYLRTRGLGNKLNQVIANQHLIGSNINALNKYTRENTNAIIALKALGVHLLNYTQQQTIYSTALQKQILAVRGLLREHINKEHRTTVALYGEIQSLIAVDNTLSTYISHIQQLNENIHHQLADRSTRLFEEQKFRAWWYDTKHQLAMRISAEHIKQQIRDIVTEHYKTRAQQIAVQWSGTYQYNQSNTDICSAMQYMPPNSTHNITCRCSVLDTRYTKNDTIIHGLLDHTSELRCVGTIYHHQYNIYVYCVPIHIRPTLNTSCEYSYQCVSIPEVTNDSGGYNTTYVDLLNTTCQDISHTHDNDTTNSSHSNLQYALRCDNGTLTDMCTQLSVLYAFQCVYHTYIITEHCYQPIHTNDTAQHLRTIHFKLSELMQMFEADSKGRDVHNYMVLSEDGLDKLHKQLQHLAHVNNVNLHNEQVNYYRLNMSLTAQQVYGQEVLVGLQQLQQEENVTLLQATNIHVPQPINITIGNVTYYHAPDNLGAVLDTVVQAANYSGHLAGQALELTAKAAEGVISTGGHAIHHLVSAIVTPIVLIIAFLLGIGIVAVIIYIFCCTQYAKFCPIDCLRRRGVQRERDRLNVQNIRYLREQMSYDAGVVELPTGRAVSLHNPMYIYYYVHTPVTMTRSNRDHIHDLENTPPITLARVPGIPSIPVTESTFSKFQLYTGSYHSFRMINMLRIVAMMMLEHPTVEYDASEQDIQPEFVNSVQAIQDAIQHIAAPTEDQVLYEMPLQCFIAIVCISPTVYELARAELARVANRVYNGEKYVPSVPLPN